MKLKPENENRDPNRKKVLYIHFSVEDEEGLKKKLETLKNWYNTHWFMSEDVLVEQAKVYVADHIKIMVDENENL